MLKRVEVELSRTNLTVIQQADDDHTPANVSQRSRQEPVKVGVDGYCPVNDSRQNLATAGDTVSKPSGANQECQQVDDCELSDCPMACGDRPRDQSNQPAPNNSTPEKMT